VRSTSWRFGAARTRETPTQPETRRRPRAGSDQREPSSPRVLNPGPSSSRAGDRNSAHPPQHKSSRRAALLARQKRGAAVARPRNHRKSRKRRHPPNNKTYVACSAVTNEHSGKFPNPNKREKARSTRRLGLSCRRSLVSTRAEIDPKFTKKPLQPASPNREDNQRQPVGSRDFVGNGIENDPA